MNTSAAGIYAETNMSDATTRWMTRKAFCRATGCATSVSTVEMYPVPCRSVVLLSVRPGMASRSENHAMKGTAVTTTETNVLADVVDSESDRTEEPVEEILIEEISIDGMCGVY